MEVFLTILVGSCSLVYLIMQIWMYLGWRSLRPPVLDRSASSLPPISVIICAHDEEANLLRFLPTVLAQRYPAFEVVVVLDRCTDGSLAVVQALQAQHARLRYLAIEATPAGWRSKKWALEQGIGVARYACLALTDADCGVSPDWLGHMAAHFQTGKEVVLGLGMYERQPGLLNAFIRHETLYTALQYIGLAAQGIPYMAVGRNLGYLRTFYQQHGGMEAFKGRLSGDDDLLVNAYARARYTGLMVTPESMSWSVPKRRWSAWLRQKQRHVSAAPAYSFRTKFLLGLFHVSHGGFYAGICVALGFNLTNWAIFSFYMCRILISGGIFAFITQSLKEKNTQLLFPILDALYFIYNFFIVPLGLIKEPEWKK